MKFSITKAAVATAAMMLGAALPASAITNPTLLYSFENPPGDPNGPLDGFTANNQTPGDSTVSVSTVGATNGTNSLNYSAIASATFDGAITSLIPGATNDPSTTAIALDLTIPAGMQYPGGFADIGVFEFGNANNGSSQGVPTQILLQYQHSVAMASGTYRIVIPLITQFNPITGDFGHNFQGVTFSSVYGTDPNNQLTPTSFELYFNKGTGANTAALNVDMDNVQAVSDSIWFSTSADWNTAGNWIGAIPNGIDAAADFMNATLTGTQTITTAAAETLGTIRFNSSSATNVLSGAGSLTLQSSSGSALLELDEGAANVNIPLTIASNTSFTTYFGGSAITISAPLTVNSGKSLNATGPGTVSYTSTITLQSNASITFSNFTAPQSLSLATGSTATIAAHGTNPVDLLELNTLSFGGTTNAWQGKLDINDNTMIVHNTSSAAATTELGQLINQLKEGYTGGWHGTAGITSSIAATTKNTAIGIELNDNGSGGALFSTFAGQPVTNTDILIGYTFFGDANLDGKVDAADYGLIDTGFAMHLTTWRNGDFNYDGVINGDDYTLIDNAFNTQGNVVLNAIPAAELALNTSQIAVPEPTAISLLIFGITALTTRRRHRRLPG